MGKSNRKIEAIFDECLDNVLTGQSTLEQCLQKYPGQAAELESLLRTALSISSAVAVQPDPQAKARGRYQLQLKMAQIGKPRRAPFFGWQPRWATGIVTAMLVFTIGGGTVLAADGSMPGSPLYPIKIATENVRVKLAGTDVEKEAILATCADRRVAEVAQVVAKGNASTQLVNSVADRYVQQLDQMSGMISSGDQPTVTSGMGIMGATESTSPEVPQPETTAPPALAAGQTPGENTTQPSAQATVPPQVASVPDGDKKQVQTASNLKDDEIESLKVRIIAYAISHPEQIDKLLNDPKVPEQSKVALRRMLRNAKEKYAQAVKSLEHQQKESEQDSHQGNDD